MKLAAPKRIEMASPSLWARPAWAKANMKLLSRTPQAGDRYRQSRDQLLRSSFDSIRPDKKIGRNFPCLANLVDHVDREGASAGENFRRTRS